MKANKENIGTDIILSQEKIESQYLEQIVCDCWDVYTCGKIFAPYFALVQSSGSGKTTCMKLLSESKNNFVVKYILANSEDPTELAEIFENTMKKSCALKQETVAKGLISEFFENLFDSSRTNVDKICVLCIDEARWLCDLKAKYHDPEPRTGFELLRKTLSEFTADKTRKLVIVLADTISVVGNFVPENSKFNPHMKTKLKAPTLFPVIHRIPFFDVFA